MRAVHPINMSSQPQPVGTVPNVSRTTHDPNEPTTFSKILDILILACGSVLLVYITYNVLRGFIIASVRDPRLEINSLTVSNLNLSSHPNQISADWNVEMNFKTRDMHGYFNLSDVKVLVYYNDKIVGVTNFVSFYVSPKKSPMQFGGHFSSRFSGDSIDDSMISHIAQGMHDAGTLKFKVELLASVIGTYKGWGTESLDPCLWAFTCENVELIFGSLNASEAHMLNGSHKCKLAVSTPHYID